MNSMFKCNRADEYGQYGDARLIDWKHNNGNSPKTFTMDDKDVVDEAIKNENMMFARKFEADIDKQIIAYIEEKLNSEKIAFDASKGMETV